MRAEVKSIAHWCLKTATCVLLRGHKGPCFSPYSTPIPGAGPQAHREGL
jgi:hypothetical protein